MGISILFNPIKSEWDDPGILLGYMYVGGPINFRVNCSSERLATDCYC